MRCGVNLFTCRVERSRGRSLLNALCDQAPAVLELLDKRNEVTAVEAAGVAGPLPPVLFHPLGIPIDVRLLNVALSQHEEAVAIP